MKCKKNYLLLSYQILRLVILCITGIHQSTNGVLYRFDHIKTANKKNLYIFHEEHVPAAASDMQQLDTLSTILALRDQNHLPKTHLMVEVPALLVQERSGAKKVTHNLIDRVAHCQSIIAEDVEIRCVSYITGQLFNFAYLDRDGESEAENQINAGPHWCKIGAATIEMLMDELNTRKTSIQPDLNCMPQNVCIPKYTEVEKCIDRITACLIEHHALHDERIIDFIKRLYSNSSLSNFARLDVAIAKCDNHLFDLHLLQSILHSPYNDCIIITGGEHSECVCRAMEQSGSQYQISEGSGSTPLNSCSWDIIKSVLT